MGDLHYEVEELPNYLKARDQLVALKPDFLASLGDVGGYSHPGTAVSFREAAEFFSGFGVPWRTLLGNHDMEGKEFATDLENLSSWKENFSPHFDTSTPWKAVDLGNALGIFLSNTRFRENTFTHHEVFLGDAQIAWFEKTLAENKNKITFVFCHVPVMGSGLGILVDPHLKAPNAFVHHSHEPEQFRRIVLANPQIKLWFSAHNHLGQFHEKSVGQLGECRFIHTGVIGKISRDRSRHTRVLRFDERGYEISTFDHERNAEFTDLSFQYGDKTPTRKAPPATAALDPFFFAPSVRVGELASGESFFHFERNWLLEYDLSTSDPIGIVEKDVAECFVRDGALVLTLLDGNQKEVRPGPTGRFRKVFFPNPFREIAVKS